MYLISLFKFKLKVITCSVSRESRAQNKYSATRASNILPRMSQLYVGEVLRKLFHRFETHNALRVPKKFGGFGSISKPVGLFVYRVIKINCYTVLVPVILTVSLKHGPAGRWTDVGDIQR